jgi:Cft2 family RNA processing exonuclease
MKFTFLDAADTVTGSKHLEHIGDQCILLDSAKLQEEHARHANKFGYSRYDEVSPLYGVADAKRAIAKKTPIPAGRALRLGSDGLLLLPVDHGLGASAVSLRCGDETMAFSGDEVYGAPAAANVLPGRIKDELGWVVHVPEYLATEEA